MDADAPAACSNIGPRERRLRNIVGVVGTTVTILLASALFEAHASKIWRLILVVPVYTAAMGFLQARAHTCVAFARKNIRVMGDSRDHAESITDDTLRAAIAKTARRIYLQGGAVVAAVAVLALALP
jgi:hypothetical protein